MVARTRLGMKQLNKLMVARNGITRVAKGPHYGVCSEYLLPYRPPSVRYPFSYLRALRTYKFSAWLQENYPTHAIQLGLMSETDDWTPEQGAKLLTEAVCAWNDGPT